jgi:hypothetical protein
MSRIGGIILLLFAVPACRLPPDRTPLKPLPEDGQVFTYEEILSRARAQATAALEAFYVDNWPEIAEAARGLEQTARFLPKTSAPPPKLVGKLVTESVQLHKDAGRLAEVAKAKDVNATNEILQKVILQIRQLRPEPVLQPPEVLKDKDKKK